jgi:hypothetical protein
MRVSHLLPLIAVSLLVCAVHPLAGQKIECVFPAEPANANDRCTYQAPPGKATHPLVVRLADTPNQMNQTISFFLDPATQGSVTNSATTDANGLATLVWTGQPGPKETVIRAVATVAGRTVQREIQVTATPTSTTTARSLRLPDDMSVPHWFIERQLFDSVRVLVENPVGDCGSNAVLFKPATGDGTASPDTVRPVLENGACVAATWWTLGKPVGRQHLRASLVNESAKAVSVTAIGRNIPRVGVGIAFVRDTRNYQFVDTSGAVLDVEHDTEADPAILVDFPVFPKARWLRGVAGVSLEDPSRDWYAGISLMQLIFGVTRESVGVDLQGVMHAGRRDVLRDRSCDDDEDVSDCANKDKLFFPLGFGIMGFVDTTAFISTLTGIF